MWASLSFFLGFWYYPKFAPVSKTFLKQQPSILNRNEQWDHDSRTCVKSLSGWTVNRVQSGGISKLFSERSRLWRCYPLRISVLHPTWKHINLTKFSSAKRLCQSSGTEVSFVYLLSCHGTLSHGVESKRWITYFGKRIKSNIPCSFFILPQTQNPALELRRD